MLSSNAGVVSVHCTGNTQQCAPHLSIFNCLGVGLMFRVYWHMSLVASLFSKEYVDTYVEYSQFRYNKEKKSGSDGMGYNYKSRFNSVKGGILAFGKVHMLSTTRLRGFLHVAFEIVQVLF